MFQVKRKNLIEGVQGDTGIISLKVRNYDFVEGDKVYFTVKKSISDKEVAIQKIVDTFENNEAKIYLSSDETNIEADDYVYDIQLSLKDGRVDTVVRESTFTVLAGVTCD